MTPKTLHLEGSAETIVRNGLLLYREAIKKAKKKDEELGLEVDGHDESDGIAKDILTQLGWKPKAEKGRVEVTGGDDPAQLDLTAGIVPQVFGVVQCFGCSRRFTVPPGHGFYACPDCSCIHRVTSSDDGTVYRLAEINRMPDDIAELHGRRRAGNPLSESEIELLDSWIATHPDYMSPLDELNVGGELPAVPEPGAPGATLEDPGAETPAPDPDEDEGDDDAEAA